MYQEENMPIEAFQRHLKEERCVNNGGKATSKLPPVRNIYFQQSSYKWPQSHISGMYTYYGWIILGLLDSSELNSFIVFALLFPCWAAVQDEHKEELCTWNTNCGLYPADPTEAYCWCTLH